ncbi:MAG: TetR/AcrR family transcriptional regulator [Calditrichales bacterium]|nr:MAG: TetR/AcrR family transcriptional regulator [Calditrichales bacterium]
MENQNKPQPVSPRRQRNREHTIQTILDTAREIMREHGAAALSMHELARRLDMRAPSLYNYFSSLMDIYDALFRQGFSLWDGYVKESIKDARTWQELLQALMEAYMSFAIQNPELYQLCFERPVPGFVPSEESLQLSAVNLEEMVVLTARIKNDIHTDLPLKQMTDLLIAITHGMTALHIANEPQLPLGQGRFGGLIPAALSILETAWSKK